MPPEMEVGQAAPVVSDQPATPAAAQPNAATAEATTGGAEGGNPSQEQKTFTQAELDEILQKRIAKAEARAERRVLRTLERVIPQAQPQGQQPSQQAPADDRPTPRQGETTESYVDRLTDWKLDQRDRQASTQREQEQHKTLAQKTESIYAEAQKLAGFDREAFDELPLTKPIVEALVDSDNAARLMHHLASNPEEVDRIAKLSPARQAAELGKLEATLGKAPPKTSKTPDPITPIGAGNTTVPTDPSRMNHEQYREWRKKQGARWA